MTQWNLIDPESRTCHAIAISSFSHSNPHTLSFKLGDLLVLQEETQNWFRGHLTKKPHQMGIFPKSFVKIYDPKLLNHSDPAVPEIEATLREWTSVWLKKYDECDKRKIIHNLMSYFKSVLHLKNVIVENKASIDEVKEMKKLTMSKILQGNSLLGLDVIAFDSNYNRLSVDETTTIQLYEELKKNSEFSSNPAQLIMNAHNNSLAALRDDSFISDGNLTNFQHKSSYHNAATVSSSMSRNTSPTYCLKLSLESLSPSANCNYSDENSELCINLFMYKENSAENSFYLCETAAFNMSQIPNAKKSELNGNSFPILSDGTSLSPLLQSTHTGKYAIFCDLSEKDFDMTKSGYKLLLVVYAVKNIKQNNMDRHSSISKIFAGGVCDLGSNLCNIIFVNTEVRNVQGSMSLYMSEFDNSIVTFKTLQEFINTNDPNSTSRVRGSSKDAFLTLTFRTELNEFPFNKIAEKYGHLQPKIFRKMDFPEVIMPDDFRNDFYVTVMSGDFQKAKNYEFVVNLVQFREDSSSRWIECPVDFNDEMDSTAAGESSKKRPLFFHKSIVYAKQDKPKWNEIVKVSIPNGKKVEEIRKLYLRFLIRSRSLDGKDKTKIVGVCYLQITNENGSAIQDFNRCYLQMSKLDNENESTSLDGYYYQLKHTQYISKSSIAQMSSIYTNSDRLKDFIEIKVKVVSTQLTQNATLLNLLSFPTDARPDVESYRALNNYLNELLSFKDNEQSAEIVKFLQAILDKLIDILLDLRGKDLDETTLDMHVKLIQPRVFEILVSIFQIIESQSRFASFRTVIDAYLSKNFCTTLAHRPLLRIFKDIISKLYEKYASVSEQTNGMHNTTINSANSESNLMYPLPPGSPLSYPRKSTQSNLTNSNHSNNSSLYLAEMPSNEKEYIEAIKTIKSMEFIFKFAFRSRELLSIYNRSNSSANGMMNGSGGESFDQDVAEIFAKFTDIANLRSNGGEDGNLTRIQSYVLKYVIGLLPILIQSKRYSFGRISELYVGFLQSRYILTTNFLSKFINTKLFETPESRRVVMGHVCSALNNLLTNPASSNESLHPTEEKSKLEQRLEAVGRVVSELMNVLERKSVSKTSSQDMSDVCRLLPNLCNTFLYFFEFQERKLKQLYGTILVSIMRLMDSSHYDLFFTSPTSFLSLPFHTTIEQFLHRTSLVLSSSSSINIEERVNKMLIRVKTMCEEDTLGQLAVIKLIYTCKVLLEEDTFPRDWFDLQVLRNSVILSCMQHVANRISKHHVETFGTLNKQIWHDYFIIMVNLTTDPCLQLESFNENKTKNMMNKYGDMRIRAAEEIKKMWYNLGNKKHYFLPQIVEPFMRVAILPIGEVHHSVIPLFFDMINCEHLTKTNKMTGTASSFDEYTVPRQLITTIDSQICYGYGDVKFRNNIERILKERFNAHVILKNNVDFVNSLVELIDLLIEYRELKEESLDELKTFYLNEILTFYGNMRRYDIYVKYVEILRAIHKSSKNPVCAAYTLKLHADLLSWTNEPLETYLQHPSHPNQSKHKDLKELLYEDLVHNFTEGQAWEKAFELSKILRGIYESEYKLEKLYKFLREEAELCENIVKKERYECNYFMVGFFGKKFPKLLQNKRFVFRSHPFEHIVSFCPRIESWFPKSIRITHSNSVSESEMNSDAQYIQVIKVLPVFEPKEQFKQLNLSTKILKYYHHNEVSKFKFTNRKDSQLNENDPTLWWTKETMITISNPLPDVVSFYPVVQETSEDISPIQFAINQVKEKLERLKLEHTQMQQNRQVTESSKSIIQGTLDAGVGGGLPKYKIFFDPTYINANPESVELVEELKKLVIDTINQGEALLDLAIEIKPDPLLVVIKDERINKVKLLFDMSVQPTTRLRRPTISTTNPTMSINTTTSSLMLPSNTNQSHSSSNESIMGPIVPFTDNNHTGTPSKHISSSLNLLSSKASFLKERNLFSYFSGSKNNNTANQEKSDKLSNQLSFSTTNSHRDSMSSIKSDEIFNSSQGNAAARTIFELDETVNPKRPPRPPPKPNNLLLASSSSSQTPASSNGSSSLDSQSSRPVSHLSKSQNQSETVNDSIINLIQGIQDDMDLGNQDDLSLMGGTDGLLITSSQILVVEETNFESNNAAEKGGSMLANQPPPKPPKLVKKIS